MSGLSTIVVNETTTATMNCIAMGRPAPAIAWFNGSTPLNETSMDYNSSTVVGDLNLETGFYSVTSSLDLFDTTATDGGVYYCQATTTENVSPDMANASINLTVQGKKLALFAK